MGRKVISPSYSSFIFKVPPKFVFKPYSLCYFVIVAKAKTVRLDETELKIFFLNYLFIYLFYLWLCWVFVSV